MQVTNLGNRFKRNVNCARIRVRKSNESRIGVILSRKGRRTEVECSRKV